ncbi:MAG TPA: hypothetical protein VIM57_07565 [Luteolibacter sp.]
MAPPKRHRTGGWKMLGLSLLAGFVFYGIDLAWKGSPMTPLLAVCWLMAASLRNGPRRVTAALVILFGFVVVTLSGQGWDRLVIRGLSFLAGGSLAVMYAHSRERAERVVQQLLTIAGKVPAAIATADAMGCILSASDELRELVGPDFHPLEGHSLSDVLLGQIPPGEAMHRYITWFYEDDARSEKFSLRGSHEGEINGRVICSGRGEDRVLIVVLAVDEVRSRLEERKGRQT